MLTLGLPDDFRPPEWNTYPPSKTGQLIEEYCHQRLLTEPALLSDDCVYIDAFWTQLQIRRGEFAARKSELQGILDRALAALRGRGLKLFTVVQHDDGVLFDLPPDIIMFACSYNKAPSPTIIPIPLTYQGSIPPLSNFVKPLSHKTTFCSYIGKPTYPMRQQVCDALRDDPRFFLCEQHHPQYFEISGDSRFGLAPRGYGRSSFRLYEILEMGTIPVYVYDDVEWLGWSDTIPPERYCVSLPVSEVKHLPDTLALIADDQAADMMDFYRQNRRRFRFEGIFDEMIRRLKTR